MTFKEILIGEYVLRFWPSDNGWMCGITNEMMDALENLHRPWVGLTWDDLPETAVGDVAFMQGAKWAEAKLKEKNT